MRIAVTIILTVCSTVVLMALVGVLVATSGTVEVAATTKDAPLVRSFMSAVRRRGVDEGARQVSVPVELGVNIEDGAHRYAEMCAQCHGRPGAKPSELARGMSPRPPQFAERERPLSDAEVRRFFWVAKNGLRMTGMPSFGVTHSDEKLWPVISFISRLPGMPAPEYARLTGAPGEREGSNAGD